MEVSSDLAGRKSRPYDIELTARRTTNYAAGTLDPNNPPRLSPETIARMDAMTEEEIERNALKTPTIRPGPMRS